MLSLLWAQIVKINKAKRKKNEGKYPKHVYLMVHLGPVSLGHINLKQHWCVEIKVWVLFLPTKFFSYTWSKNWTSVSMLKKYDYLINFQPYQILLVFLLLYPTTRMQRGSREILLNRRFNIFTHWLINYK